MLFDNNYLWLMHISGFQFRQCLEFLDEMTEMKIPKNVIIFGAAMSCMEKCGRADIGFQLMKRMKEEGIAPNVHIYNSAISACARSNLWEKGYELYEEMEREGVKRDVVTYNAGKQQQIVSYSVNR
jgi:pentatricopeptide repeat protein